MKKLCGLAVFVLICGWAALSPAVSFEEGRHYYELESPAKYSGAKTVEAVLFLWYGCGGCYEVDKRTEAWLKKLPRDVEFIRLPAIFNDIWRYHGRIFMTLEAMGADHQTHLAVFEAMQVKRIPVKKDRDLEPLLAEIGVDRAEFMKKFKSAEVDRQMKRLDAFFAVAEPRAVPAMVINGRWLFDLNSAGGFDSFIKLAVYLIKREGK